MSAFRLSGFNSRAPRGARHLRRVAQPRCRRFNSRAPRGARRQPGESVLDIIYVSIHVPLAEHDFRSAVSATWQNRFNSRAPRGARLCITLLVDRQKSFNSRAPRGARHITAAFDAGTVSVSIHVPLAEHDGNCRYAPRRAVCFNSRAPRGARRVGVSTVQPDVSFNSRAPRGARPKP